MQTGTFRLQDNSFITGNRKYVIRKRKQPTKKPELFLIKIEPFEYVSSLFPAEENYTFDYKKKLYSFRKEKDQVTIKEL